MCCSDFGIDENSVNMNKYDKLTLNTCALITFNVLDNYEIGLYEKKGTIFVNKFDEMNPFEYFNYYLKKLNDNDYNNINLNILKKHIFESLDILLGPITCEREQKTPSKPFLCYKILIYNKNSQLFVRNWKIYEPNENDKTTWEQAVAQQIFILMKKPYIMHHVNINQTIILMTKHEQLIIDIIVQYVKFKKIKLQTQNKTQKV